VCFAGTAGIVRDKPSAIPMAVSKWWEDYESSKDEAVMQLANMVLEVSVWKTKTGCARNLGMFLPFYLRPMNKESVLATMLLIRVLRLHASCPSAASVCRAHSKFCVGAEKNAGKWISAQAGSQSFQE
jgi:hypothetical protein